jgi:serine/threonine protein kinase
MTPQEWHRIKEILQTVLEMSPAERSTYLEAACANQWTMRGQIESLVRSYEGDGALLEEPVAVAAANLALHASLASWKGRRLGAYHIVDELGEGGMGSVFRATRADGLYDKQVAIKVIRNGLSTGFFIERFRNESRILASLEHPNIARLLDAGVTEEGLPYVVLELVIGLPIDRYCDRYNLSIRGRLELFRAVCSAVQYAHQNLVVHRDLKPGNILVTDEGVPKLLDFGIAKILDPVRTPIGADRTLTVLRMMTPDFASPEQVRGEPIMPASDVYSLGVVLYVLLTGRQPYQVKSNKPHEIVKAICDDEPKRPSAAPARSESPTPTDAGRRDAFRQALSGDLDNIVLKALRKEPHRRYASVEQFSEDLRRYRISKFVARHKAGVATAVVVVMTLVAGMIATLREARVAERRFNDVRQLANSLIFDVHDSIQNLPGSTPARKLIVERALKYLDSLSQESRGDLSLQRELATAYERVGLVQGHYLQNSLGDTEGSLVSYQKALSIRQQIGVNSKDSGDRLSLAQSYRLVANQQWATGDYRHAMNNIATAVATSEAVNRARPGDLKVLKELGSDYEVAGQIQARGYAGGAGDPAKVQENYRKAAATHEAMLSINPDDLGLQSGYAVELQHLGDTLAGEDRNAALEYYTKELEIEQKLHQRSSDTRYTRGVVTAYNHVAGTYEQMGDEPRALENFERGLDISRDLVRVDPKNALFQQGLALAYANTAAHLSVTDRKVQSLEYIEKSQEIMRAVVASAPGNVQQRGYLAAIVATSGSIFMNLDRPEAALNKFDEARSIYESLPATTATGTGDSLNAQACRQKMGEAAARSGNSKLAAEYFHQVVLAVEPLLAAPKADPEVLYVAADSYSGLGDLGLREARRSRQDPSTQRRDWAEARSWYLMSLDAWQRIVHPRRGMDVGDPDRVRKKLRLCEAALSMPPGDPGS